MSPVLSPPSGPVPPPPPPSPILDRASVVLSFADGGTAWLSDGAPAAAEFLDAADELVQRRRTRTADELRARRLRHFSVR